jgi:hypothetical protein
MPTGDFSRRCLQSSNHSGARSRGEVAGNRGGAWVDEGARAADCSAAIECVRHEQKPKLTLELTVGALGHDGETIFEQGLQNGIGRHRFEAAGIFRIGQVDAKAG